MNKILAIGAVQANSSFDESIKKPLLRIFPGYIIDVLDPLGITTITNCSNQEYYALWSEYLSPRLKDYDAFFGFSFGGIILQHCLPLFHGHDKPIVLFSTPTFIDKELRDKLNAIISLCEENKLIAALNLLYRWVYYPHSVPSNIMQFNNKELARKRLIFGLNQVLNSNNLSLLKKNKIAHYHLFGDLSQLVTADNAVLYPKCNQVTVPQSGMHVLSNNPGFCKNILSKILNHE